MPFFDTLDLNDPDAQSALGYLSGLSSGFAQGAMPSRAPIPFGATLGNAAAMANQGAQEGALRSQTYRKGNLDVAKSAADLDQTLLVENWRRSQLGLPQLTAKDLQSGMISSPIFGMPMVQPSGQDQQPDSKDTPAASGASAPAAAGGASAPTTAVPGAGASPLDSAYGRVLLNQLFGIQPTDYQKAKIYADSLPAGPDKLEAERYAAKQAGIEITPQMRSQGLQGIWNPETNSYEVAGKNVNSPQGYTQTDMMGTNIVPAAGGPEAVSDIAAREAGAKASYKAMTIYDKAGNEYTVPESMLQNGAPPSGFTTTKPGPPAATGAAPAPGPTLGTKVSPFAQRVASLESSGNPNASNPQPGQTSAGVDGFNNATWLGQAKKYLPPQMLQGKTDQQILALRTDPNVSGFMTDSYAKDNMVQLAQAGIKNVGAGELYLAHRFGPQGATTILKAPVNTPLSQILPAPVIQANPDLQNATVADVYSHANQAMKGVTYGGSAQGNAPANSQAPQPIASAKPQAPAPGAPNSPVGNSNLGLPAKLDDFLRQLGPNYQPPMRPDAPPGALMGEPGKGLEEIQTADGDRLEQYSNEAAGGQKVYTNIDQLYGIIDRGLSTGPLTKAGTDLASLARQWGMNNLIPKAYDPNDANAFNKLATDLVFAQLKQIGGRPMVSEIEGLKQANPSTALTPAANNEILNNIMADQRWKDARSDLGRQYMTKFGSLGDFDARFNETYPEVNLYNKVTNAATKAGMTLPGGPGTPSGRAAASVTSQLTPENLAYTAQRKGMTVDQVKQELRRRGIQVQ